MRQRAWKFSALVLIPLLISLIEVSNQNVAQAVSVSMSVVAPGPVTDLARVEARVSLRNPGDASQDVSLTLHRESTLGVEAVAAVTLSIPPGGQTLFSDWIPTGGHAGTNTIKYSVSLAGAEMTGESSFQVVASATRATPVISAVWIDPGAVLPGVYFQTRPVTAADVRDSIDAAHSVGVDTLIISYSEYILNNWGTFYPSQHYGSVASFDVVGTILNQASQNGQKVFVGLGRGDDLTLTYDGFNDPVRIAAALEHGAQLATELWELYSHEPSFFGWYLSHEANDIRQASNAYYNPMTDFLREFQADKPVLISPSGTPIISPSILADSHVDIFAYQDAVGAGYIPYQYTYDPQERIDTLDAVYGSYQTAHAGVDKHLWTNLESWQMNGPTYAHPFPADFSRLYEQLEIEKNYVDSISSYEWLGFFEHPETTVFLGGQKALNLYAGYRDYYDQIKRELKIVNYARNPGFEEGLAQPGGQPSEWHFAGNGVDQTVSLSNEGASGSPNSLSLDVDSTEGLPWLIQDIPVLSGVEYKFSAFVKQLVGDPSGGWLAAQVWLLSDQRSSEILGATSLHFSNMDWELQSSFVTVPVGAHVARIVLAIQDSSYGVGTGHYLIDGISLVGPKFPALAGDFDGNFAVNGQDLLEWEMNYGNGGGPDADGDGNTDGAEFLAWQRNMGSALSPNSLLAAVPEPTAFSLVAFGFLATLSRSLAIASWPQPDRRRKPRCAV